MRAHSAWNGQMDEAESMYAQLAKTGNANAKKGLARVIGWRGELERSERTWREVLVTDPADPEALTGLAQVLSWQGRQADAETALQAALRANPAYGDARALLRWVQADLRPSVTIAGIGTNDSDNNRSTSFVLDYVVRAPVERDRRREIRRALGELRGDRFPRGCGKLLWPLAARCNLVAVPRGRRRHPAFLLRSCRRPLASRRSSMAR